MDDALGHLAAFNDQMTGSDDGDVLQPQAQWSYDRLLDTMNAPPPRNDQDREFLWNISLVAAAVYWATDWSIPNADLAAKYFLASTVTDDGVLSQLVQKVQALPEGENSRRAEEVLLSLYNPNTGIQRQMTGALFDALYKQLAPPTQLLPRPRQQPAGPQESMTEAFVKFARKKHWGLHW